MSLMIFVALKITVPGGIQPNENLNPHVLISFRSCDCRGSLENVNAKGSKARREIK